LRIVVATDAWYPQINGVVRVLSSVLQHLRELGHEVLLISPSEFRTIPCPTYPEIPLSILPRRRIARLLDDFAPDAVHIATEGPIGWATRQICRRRNWSFTTAYHSKLPEYVHLRTKLPLPWLYGFFRRFHRPAARTLAPARSVYAELIRHRFDNVVTWSHGVDVSVFTPKGKAKLDLPRPIYMYVGRLAVEKNLPGFLDLDLDGSKVVVGTGPARDDLMRQYPDAHFFIADGDGELAEYFSAGDVFVFPSLTDTFGLVMLEALACGVPVAAYPVPGPLDVIGGSDAGVLDHDLAAAARRAGNVPRDRCLARAREFSWGHVTGEFLDYLEPIDTTLQRKADGYPAAM